jgi:hypothetical protein
MNLQKGTDGAVVTVDPFEMGLSELAGSELAPIKAVSLPSG